MKRALLALGFSLAYLISQVMIAQAAGTPILGGTTARPTVWMSPPPYEQGRCFRELFEHPEQWSQTRSAVDVLFYSDLCLQKQFSDQELRGWFTLLKQWKLKFAMEVGAIKPWAVKGEITGEKIFDLERPSWERFQRLGADLYAIVMDEPLSCTRFETRQPDDYAVAETARYIAAVRKRYPSLVIGETETYPSIPLADHLWWIDALQKRLAEMHLRGLDFYRLDVNWSNFVVFDRGNWREVRKLELACRQRKLPFSLIYWSSDGPNLQRLALADDCTWCASIMRQGYDYAMVDGAPDQYSIESWIKMPPHSVPETDRTSFTGSVLEFTRKFVNRRR